MYGISVESLTRKLDEIYLCGFMFRHIGLPSLFSGLLAADKTEFTPEFADLFPESWITRFPHAFLSQVAYE